MSKRSTAWPCAVHFPTEGRGFRDGALRKPGRACHGRCRQSFEGSRFLGPCHVEPGRPSRAPVPSRKLPARISPTRHQRVGCSASATRRGLRSENLHHAGERAAFAPVGFWRSQVEPARVSRAAARRPRGRARRARSQTPPTEARDARPGRRFCPGSERHHPSSNPASTLDW